MIDHAARVLEDAFTRSNIHALVARERDLLLTSHTTMIPDLTVFLNATTHEVPDLVIEYRAESTDRLFLGPKRLAYARAGIREVWFAEPANGTIVALRRSEALDFPWPAPTYGFGETISAESIPELTLPVSTFFTSALLTNRDALYEHR